MHLSLQSIYSSAVVCGVVLSLSSCATLRRSAGSIQDELKAKDEAAVVMPKGLAGLNGVQPKIMTPSQLPDEADIEWASEDPDVAMPGLDELWAAEPKNDWFESHSQALKEARKEGKPVLLWFADSRSKMSTQALSDELFSNSKFTTWAAEKVVRLRIDSTIEDSDEGRLARKRQYVNDLKKRYKVMGSPVVLMLSPRGSVFGKYTGYKSGDSSFYFGRLKNSYRNAVVDYGKWREDLESKGYRIWHDHRGRKVFAKPRAIRNGTLYLVAPGGSRSKTSLSKLSAEDRSWVEEQQRKKSRRNR